MWYLDTTFITVSGRKTDYKLRCAWHRRGFLVAQNSSQCTDQFRDLERFLDVCKSVLLEEFSHRSLGSVRNREYEPRCHFRMILQHPPVHIRGIVLTRHLAVDDDGVKNLLLQQANRFRPILRAMHFRSRAQQQFALEIEHCIFVVDHQDLSPQRFLRDHHRQRIRKFRLRVQG